MISFITGLPGAGKGVYSTIKIIDELRETRRPIITNFAVELHPWVRRLGRQRSKGEKGLLAYLRDTYGETFDAEKRIHVVTDEQIAQFYLWRCADDYSLQKIGCTLDKAGNVESLEESVFAHTLPCVYLVDEAWKFWSARGWQSNEKGFQFYNAQHRKAGDDLWITAQHASQIDKQMRVLVQEYHTLVNHKFRKIGIFKQPNVISCFVSNEPPEMRQKTVGALPKVIRFDKEGIGACFDTAKGAGVQGAGADIEKKPKGLPWWGTLLALLLFGFGVVGGARAMGWGAGMLLTGGMQSQPGKAVQKGAAEMSRPWNPLQSPTNPPAGEFGQVLRAEPVPELTGRVCYPAVIVAGRMERREHWKLLLSNGDIVDTESGRVQLLTQDYAVIDGVTNHFRRLVADSRIMPNSFHR